MIFFQEDEEEKKKFHTLESDEEEEEDHKRLDTRRVEGQEDCGVDFDGSIKITAFNMKEDEEEGHFDETGNFIFDKKTKDVQDAWLDGIDWSLVKKKAGDQWEGDEDKVRHGKWRKNRRKNLIFTRKLPKNRFKPEFFIFKFEKYGFTH